MFELSESQHLRHHFEWLQMQLFCQFADFNVVAQENGSFWITWLKQRILRSSVVRPIISSSGFPFREVLPHLIQKLPKLH